MSRISEPREVTTLIGNLIDATEDHLRKLGVDPARIDEPSTNGKPHRQPAVKLPLSEKHLADLRSSGLSDEQIARCGFYTERDPAKVLALLKWKGDRSKFGDCLVFPYFDDKGLRLDHVRLKPDIPRARTPGKKPSKYENPLGSKNHFYIPPATGPLLRNVGAPLLFTEGEKKAAKADQEGYACIGLGGVDGWSKSRPKDESGAPTGPRKLRNELADLPWRGRLVYIVFDSDQADNYNVRRTQRQLGKALKEEGAVVHLVVLEHGPQGPDGKPIKMGLDDYIVAEGIERFREKLASTSPAIDADLVVDDRIVIWVSPQELRVNNAAMAALAGNQNIYQRDRQLVRIARRNGSPSANGAHRGLPPGSRSWRRIRSGS